MARDGRVEALLRGTDLRNVGAGLLDYARREQWSVKFWGYARKKHLDLVLSCMRVGATLGVAQDQPRNRRRLSEKLVASRMHQVWRMHDNSPEGRDKDWIRILDAEDPTGAIDQALEKLDPATPPDFGDI